MEKIIDCIWLSILSIALAFMITLMLVAVTHSHDYDHADNDSWYRELRQPDNPIASCCGGKDAYYADKVEECGPQDFVPGLYGGCALVAVITDDRKVEGRFPHPPGTRIPIPRSKIRKNPSFNPTDHTVVFVGPQKQVYCYEPLALN